MEKDSFGVVDYVVFSIMLLISALIGVWQACVGGKQNTTAEYLLADRRMNFLPVSISVLVSYLSAISLLGLPAEIFFYGTQFYLTLIGMVLTCCVANAVFLPMFRRIRITCINEYLEQRYSVGMRMVGSLLFGIGVTLYLFVALFAPSLALEAVAGIPLTVSILATGIVCTFYTALGGLKAVIWTDVFQSVIMLAGMLTVAVTGTIEVGGVKKVWEINEKYGRINFFDFNPDPRVRNTFWSLTIGFTITLVPVWSLNQCFIQRYLAVKTLRDAKKVVWLNIPCLLVVVTILALDGMVIFANYAGCDLFVQGKITRGDQVVPYFVINKLGHLSGLSGLFTACLYSAALSTISSALSGMSLIMLEDFIKKKVKLTDNEATKISKVIAVVFGAITMAGAFSVKYAGAMVLQLAYSISGLTGGIMLSLFLAGFFIPRANAKGMYMGVFAGFGLVLWVFIGSVLYPPNNYPGVRSVRECSFYQDALAANSTFANGTYDNSSAKIFRKYGDGLIRNSFKPYTSNPFADLYSLSYLWFSTLTFVTTTVVGLTASLLLETKEDRKRQISPKLFFPLKAWLYGFLPGHHFSWEEETYCDETDIELKKTSHKGEDTRF